MNDEEIKTLKDLDFQKIAINSREKQIIEIVNENLKKEVTKLIKLIERKIEEIRRLESKPQSPLQRVATRGLDEILEGQIKVLRDFFNLVEEEAQEDE